MPTKKVPFTKTSAGDPPATDDEGTLAPPLQSGGRDDQIRLAAYLIAEHRGFAPGSDVDDWLAAEQAANAAAGN